MRNSVSVTVVLQYANGENGDEILSVGFVTESVPSLAELIRLIDVCFWPNCDDSGSGSTRPADSRLFPETNRSSSILAGIKSCL